MSSGIIAIELKKVLAKSDFLFDIKQNVDNYYKDINLNDTIGLMKVTLILWTLANLIIFLEILFKIIFKTFNANNYRGQLVKRRRTTFYWQ